MSTFSGLNTATTALWAQRRGMDVTGQNVANVNTAGYSRQRVDLQSMGGSTVPAIYSVSNQMGGGVTADQVTRVRDAFLEARAQTEHANAARMTVENDALGEVESAFREPGDTGIQAMLGQMWAGWSDVVNHPQDAAARSQLLQRTQTLVAGIQTTAAGLDQQWQQTRDDLQTLVSDVNAAATSIAELNSAIKRGTQAGLPVNELADKRDVLVLDLAGKIGATGVPGDDGVVNVVVGGTSLVTGTSALGLRLTGATSAGGAVGDPPRVVTSPGISILRIGGTAEGQVSVLATIVPTYRAQLDGIAQQLATTLNAAQAKGFDQDGAPGMPLLDDGTGTGATPVDPATVTAANLRVRTTDTRGVAAAAVSPATAGGRPSADGGNADATYQLRLGADGVDSTYRKLITNLGVRAAVADRNLSVQNVITAQVDTSRESVSGVNLDEEMTNMLSYQHAYSAAARLVTAIDESLDVLINRTGLVGR